MIAFISWHWLTEKLGPWTSILAICCILPLSYWSFSLLVDWRDSEFSSPQEGKPKIAASLQIQRDEAQDGKVTDLIPMLQNVGETDVTIPRYLIESGDARINFFKGEVRELLAGTSMALRTDFVAGAKLSDELKVHVTIDHKGAQRTDSFTFSINQNLKVSQNLAPVAVETDRPESTSDQSSQILEIGFRKPSHMLRAKFAEAYLGESNSDTWCFGKRGIVIDYERRQAIFTMRHNGHAKSLIAPLNATGDGYHRFLWQWNDADGSFSMIADGNVATPTNIHVRGPRCPAPIPGPNERAVRLELSNS
jgi:hypothetical protein